jgi:uncharacterized protein YcbX
MHVAEIWRYPVKSLAGERLEVADVSLLGIAQDREIVILHRERIATARRYPKLLGLHGGLDDAGTPTVDGHPWNTAAAHALAEEAIGGPVRLIHVEGPERFDILPLLVATDGAIATLGVDRRRFRPNILIGGVNGIDERTWPGKQIRIGEVVIAAAKLRERCVMTTYDPDTLVQDLGVLKRIVSDFDGTMALDCSVVTAGRIHLRDSVEVL